jgi:2-amino-4-hydroxy-6-hydroxymethyldihydropteridine diphosphokinase
VTERAFVGLGANLGDAAGTLGIAVDELAALPGATLAACSSLYATRPIGGPEQPDYTNAVVALDVGADPLSLLAALQGIEARAGRVRTIRWGPRTLDLDLLLYGRRAVALPELVVPHPRLTERRFALEPLLELDPEAALPDGRRLAAIAAALPDQGTRRLPGSLTATIGRPRRFSCGEPTEG